MSHPSHYTFRIFVDGKIRPESFVGMGGDHPYRGDELASSFAANIRHPSRDQDIQVVCVEKPKSKHVHLLRSAGIGPGSK